MKKIFFTKVGKWVTFKTLQKLNIRFRPSSQYDLIYFVKKLNILDFRGIYMRDKLLPNKSLNIECGYSQS